MKGMNIQTSRKTDCLHRICLALAGALLLGIAPVSNGECADRYEVLMVGNSHSRANDLPGLVRKLIEHGVPGASVHTELAPGSAFLAERLDLPSNIEALNSRPWTHVILQAQKYSTSGQFTYPTTAAEEWIRRIKARGAMPVMFPEWPRFGNHEEGPRVHQLHVDIASREPACVAPIGLAWEDSLRLNPDIYLHAPDGNHSNLNGALLTAYVLYEVITTLPASELTNQGNLGVDATTQQILRAIASQTVRNNPPNCPGVETIPRDNTGLSGSYFMPERNGEGIVVQWLPDGRVLVYFFTFDLDNNQQWILGIGQSDGTRVTMDAHYPSGSTTWGADFDANEVVLSPWGTFELVWKDCAGVQFSYESILEGNGSASYEYVRLTNLREADCPAFD